MASTGPGTSTGKAAAAGLDGKASTTSRFISAAVADIATNVGINAARVYVTGMSNGGIMSYTLACTTDIFAAIGPVAGTQLNPCRTPHPMSVMHIHGTADRLVPYGGGQGFSVINGPSVPDVNAFWRNVDQCGGPSATTSGPITTSTRRVRRQAAASCSSPSTGAATSGRTSRRETLWEFFAAHSR